MYNGYYLGWGQPILGANKCIYFPPNDHKRVLKYNPSTQHISLTGNSCGDELCKWYSAALGSDGYIYCIPYNTKQILQIDARHINDQIVELVQNMWKTKID